MSDDADPFRSAQEIHESETHKCNLCKQARKLSATRRKQLRDAVFGKTKVNGKKIATAIIVEVLADWGVATSTTSVNLHGSGGTHLNPLSPMCRSMVASAWGADNVE
jgi:hypothetical protein